MATDAVMLAAALAAGARLADAERTADIARAEFHHAVRRVHLAGGALPEIADALGLSYERVRQIAEGAAAHGPHRLARFQATRWPARSAARARSRSAS